MKPNAIIFDLDGTLCNDSHRQKFIKNKEKLTPEIWDKYHRLCFRDKPFKIVLDILLCLQKNHKIIIVTGRDEKQRVATKEWLKKYGVEFDRLHMRPNGHHVSSVDLKREIYNKYIKDDFSVLAAFEDRNCVTKMWRDLGLICFQCKDGDY